MWLAWFGEPTVGLALRGPGDVVAAGPGTRLQPFRPVRPDDSFSLDGNHGFALDLPADAGRTALVSIAPISHMSVSLPISIWMTWRSSSDRCEYASPIGAVSSY